MKLKMQSIPIQWHRFPDLSYPEQMAMEKCYAVRRLKELEELRASSAEQKIELLNRCIEFEMRFFEDFRDYCDHVMPHNPYDETMPANLIQMEIEKRSNQSPAFRTN